MDPQRLYPWDDGMMGDPGSPKPSEPLHQRSGATGRQQAEILGEGERDPD